MTSESKTSRPQARLTTRHVAMRLSATKLAVAAIRGALAVSGLSAVLLLAARPTQGQTETVLYNFIGSSDGLHPSASLISDSAGNFYGTTLLGGQGCPGNQYGCGVVFEISPNGSGGWNQTVLQSFSGPPDAANPWLAPVIFDKVGNLYGTTEFGGTYNWGAVFKLSPAGAGWAVSILYSFTGGADGGHPASALVMDEAGNLYGTTSEYLAPGNVFELSPSGSGWTERVIYDAPTAPGLTMDAAGNIYGATTSTVFELSPDGGGGWTPTVIHTFTGPPGDGSSPTYSPVVDQSGNLYGTTYTGGAANNGTVYKLSPANGAWTEEILYSFLGGADGAGPFGAAVVLDAAGNIYGTTSAGGSANDGTVFELSALGNSSYQHTVLWSFSGTDGINPYCTPILDSAGNLYGTASSGGSSNAGVVFEVIRGVAVATTTTLASSLNPSGYGQTVTFTASVKSTSGTPTGTVQILNGSSAIGSATLVNGSASIPVSTLPAGSDSITASYLGGGGFGPSKSSRLTQTVTQAGTTTSLSSSLSLAATNQLITFTATMTSQYGGAANGTVVFTAGSQTLGTVALSGNVATLTSSFATAGTYSITAQYNGDSNNLGSTSPSLSEKILASTATAVASSLNPSTLGQAVTFTATVSSSGGIPPNGETVTFYNGTVVLGTAPLSAGAAALTTSSLPAGIFTIKASYPGDSTFVASTSPGLRQVVNSTTKAATSTTLVSSMNPSIYGQKVMFTATVTTTGPLPPTGTIAIFWTDGSRRNTIGTATLNSSGVATLATSNLNADAYPLAAVYRGDVNNLGSTSTVLNQVVQQTTSTASITSSPNPSTVGQAVTFTAKITSPTVMPAGPVTFKTGTTVLGTVQLSSGKATFTTSSLPAGSTTVKAIYNGDSNIKGSSAAMTQVVQP